MYKGDPQNNIFLWIKQYIYNTRYLKGELSLTALIEKINKLIIDTRTK